MAFHAGTRTGNDLTGAGAGIRVWTTYALRTGVCVAREGLRTLSGMCAGTLDPEYGTETWSLFPMEQQATELTTGGWVFLILAWTVITSLTAVCFYRVRKLD